MTPETDQTALDAQLAECDRLAVLDAAEKGIVLVVCTSCGMHVEDDGKPRCPICEGAKK